MSKEPRVLLSDEAIDLAIEMAQELLSFARQLKSTTKPEFHVKTRETIARMASAWRVESPAGLRAQRLELMNIIDKIIADHGPYVFDDEGSLLEPTPNALMVNLLHAWANDRPGARTSGSRTKSKYDLLAQYLATQGHQVSATRLKKERTESKAKSRKRPPG